MQRLFITLISLILISSFSGCSLNTSKEEITSIQFKHIERDNMLELWIEYLAFQDNAPYSGVLEYYHTDICGVPSNLEILEQDILKYYAWDIAGNIVRIQETYKHGKLNGTSKYFHETGEVRHEITYKDGEVVGPVNIYPEYNTSGGILSKTYEGEYQRISSHDVEFHEVMNSFYCYGNKISNIAYYLSTPFTGEVVYRNDCFKYDMAIRCGHFTVERYNSGKLDGTTITYDRNGYIKYIKNYEDGCRSGIWKTFDSDGIIKKETHYNNDMVKEIYYSNIITETSDTIYRKDWEAGYQVSAQGPQGKELLYYRENYEYYPNGNRIKTLNKTIYPNIISSVSFSNLLHKIIKENGYQKAKYDGFKKNICYDLNSIEIPCLE